MLCIHTHTVQYNTRVYIMYRMHGKKTSEGGGAEVKSKKGGKKKGR